MSQTISKEISVEVEVVDLLRKTDPLTLMHAMNVIHERIRKEPLGEIIKVVGDEAFFDFSRKIQDTASVLMKHAVRSQL